MPGAEDVPEASPEPEEPEEPEGEPLTVRFESIPDEHDGHRLSNTISTVIQGPPGLSVAERSAGRSVRRGLRVLHEFQLQQQAQGGRTSGGRGAGTRHPGTGVDRATDGRGEDFTGLKGVSCISPGVVAQSPLTDIALKNARTWCIIQGCELFWCAILIYI